MEGVLARVFTKEMFFLMSKGRKFRNIRFMQGESPQVVYDSDAHEWIVSGRQWSIRAPRRILEWGQCLITAHRNDICRQEAMNEVQNAIALAYRGRGETAIRASTMDNRTAAGNGHERNEDSRSTRKIRA